MANNKITALKTYRASPKPTSRFAWKREYFSESECVRWTLQQEGFTGLFSITHTSTLESFRGL